MVTDQDIIKGCRKGQAKYQRMLLEKYSGRLMAVAFRYASSQEDAKDVLQESWIRVFNHIDQYEDRGTLYSWLKTIVIHQSLKLIRKNKIQLEQKNFQTTQTDPHFPEVFEKMSIDEILKHVHALPTIPRIVFTMKILDGYAHKEIAQKLEINESTSRVYLTKARKKLMEMILENNKIAL